ncbi:NAD-dependent histone deacetylase, puytative [Candida dubliniensis CD36]|uniref:NAD-dependent histone deacetylase, puytative n=2 Tax=Candida dubliniensis TaxID=42374 RepID=B9WH41_CANDC|nr:NAD-dependent histone deacetylase, puytative [Candida dubliniensis CD36]CAX41482.1 NAD-dependent histone deacetylase, puytative [Candida dubliniensis CD36]
MISIDLVDTAGINMPAETSIKLHEVIKFISKSKKMTVLTGAGISCNAGIPDFRSSDGLYNMVKAKHPKAVVRGQDLFDISLFRDEISLSVFCTFMESLYKSTLNAKPTETHKFIKILKDKNKLLRCYTQNIDCIEKHINLKLGINLQEFDNDKFKKVWNQLDVVQLHGNLHKLSCTNCFSQFNWNEEFQTLLANGLNPECSKCMDKYQQRLYSGKRLTGQTIGLLRPDIVLYGEHHPQMEILTQGLNSDLKSKPDCLIIMGTSLKVAGVKSLVKSLSKIIHNKGGKVIYINKTKLSASSWKNYIDYEVVSDCDEFVRMLKTEIPDLFLTQEQLDSEKLNQVAVKGSGLNNPITTDAVKQEVKVKIEPGVKQETILEHSPETEPTVKQEPMVKQEVENINVKKEPIPTPPTTPHKPKNAAKLKRKSHEEINTDELHSRIKRLRPRNDQLSSPASSMNGSEEEEEDELVAKVLLENAKKGITLD